VPPAAIHERIPSHGVVKRANALTGCLQCVAVFWRRMPSIMGLVPAVFTLSLPMARNITPSALGPASSPDWVSGGSLRGAIPSGLILQAGMLPSLVVEPWNGTDAGHFAQMRQSIAATQVTDDLWRGGLPGVQVAVDHLDLL